MFLKKIFGFVVKCPVTKILSLVKCMRLLWDCVREQKKKIILITCLRTFLKPNLEDFLNNPDVIPLRKQVKYIHFNGKNCESYIKFRPSLKDNCFLYSQHYDTKCLGFPNEAILQFPADAKYVS